MRGRVVTRHLNGAYLHFPPNGRDIIMMIGQEAPGLQPKNNVAAESWGPKARTGGVSNDVAEGGKAPEGAGGKNGFIPLSQALYLSSVLSS